MKPKTEKKVKIILIIFIYILLFCTVAMWTYRLIPLAERLDEGFDNWSKEVNKYPNSVQRMLMRDPELRKAMLEEIEKDKAQEAVDKTPE